MSNVITVVWPSLLSYHQNRLGNLGSLNLLLIMGNVWKFFSINLDFTKFSSKQSRRKGKNIPPITVRQGTTPINTPTYIVPIQFSLRDTSWSLPASLRQVSSFAWTPCEAASLGEWKGAAGGLLLRLGTRWKFKSHFIKDDFWEIPNLLPMAQEFFKVHFN